MFVRGEGRSPAPVRVGGARPRAFPTGRHRWPPRLVQLAGRPARPDIRPEHSPVDARGLHSDRPSKFSVQAWFTDARIECRAPMPERGRPISLNPTPARAPTSSNLPLPRFMKRKFAVVSLATKRSILPSLLRSVATTPQAFPRYFPIPDDLLTSVKVPSPLLWKSQLGVGL